MITQYQFLLEGAEPPRSSAAYPLYAWLLQQLPKEFGDLAHIQGQSPVAQYVSCDKTAGASVWNITLLGEEAESYAVPLLDKLPEIQLHAMTYTPKLLDKKAIPTPEKFIREARALPVSSRWNMRFRSPTSFKQNNRYVIFPEEHLILQSLTGKWNAVFPEYPMDDPDALQMLAAGIHIVDYRLSSVRYPLKNTRIPGCIGEVTIEARLSAAMLELWCLLLHFSDFSGVGIKTALGMGGTLSARRTTPG